MIHAACTSTEGDTRRDARVMIASQRGAVQLIKNPEDHYSFPTGSAYQFANVAVFNTGRDERHRNVALNAVDSSPWRHLYE
jgi:hypothetical protein